MATRRYCCRACWQNEYNTMMRLARQDDKPDRTCIVCGGKISKTRTMKANTCSTACHLRRAATLARENKTLRQLEERSGRSCAWCAGAIPTTRRAGSLYCSKPCVRKAEYQKRIAARFQCEAIAAE